MSDVLVVDDDPAILDFVSDALAFEAIPYRTARNGHEALTLVRERRPAVVLLDMNMPGMDGPTFCSTLVDRGMRDGMAIVVMTAARDAPGYRVRCGADDILSKPFDLNDLYATVARHTRPV
jgi:DNA-binding response OmpR family regulator